MRLTPRQKEIAACVAKEMPTKAIARDLGLSVRTVEAHIRQAAERIEGDHYPRAKLRIWFLGGYDQAA